MKCPSCGGATKVIDSRKKPEYLYRRRVCRLCGTRFSTKEVAFNIVLPSEIQKLDQETANELARLDELTKLIAKQENDAQRYRIQYERSLNQYDDLNEKVSYDEYGNY